jgi:hypothetical protein
MKRSPDKQLLSLRNMFFRLHQLPINISKGVDGAGDKSSNWMTSKQRFK